MKSIKRILSLLLVLCLLLGSAAPGTKVYALGDTGTVTTPEGEGQPSEPQPIDPALPSVPDPTEGETDPSAPNPSEGGSQPSVPDPTDTSSPAPSDAPSPSESTPTASETDPVTILGILRAHDAWATEVQYTITLGGDLALVSSVVLRDAAGDTVLTPVLENVYCATITANGSYTVIVTDTAQQAVTFAFEESMIDLTAPIISVQPAVPDIQWQQEREYTVFVQDPGSGIAAVTLRAEDGEETPLLPNDDLTYGFTADRNTAYIISATDALGNVATVTVTEALIDREAPEISAPARESSNWSLATRYTFSVTDLGSGVAAVTLQAEGEDAIALTPAEDLTYSFTANKNTAYTISSADTLGNVATVTVTEALIDREAPEISAPVREITGWGLTAQYHFSVSDHASGVASVTVRAADGRNVPLSTGNSLTYSFVADRNISYTVTATDALGNVATITVTEAFIDQEAPVFSTLVRDITGWGLTAQYTFSVSDAGAGVSSVTVSSEDGQTLMLTSVDGSTYHFTADKNTTYTVTFTDKLGNTTSTTVTETQIDRVAPVISTPTREVSGWSQTTRYSFTASDLASGIASVVVTTPTGNVPLTVQADGSYLFIANANGSYTITVTDALGNSAQTTVSESHIDQTAPTITGIYTQKKWDAGENTVTMTITDNGVIASVTVTGASGKVYAHTVSGSTYTVVLDKNGAYTVTAVDAAGNEASQSFTVDHIDTLAPTKPVLSTSGAEQWVNVDVDVSASSEDAQSGIAVYWYHTENIPFDSDVWQKMELVNGTGILKLTKDQAKNYYVVAEDHVGRLSEPASIHVAIDKTPSDTLEVEYLQSEGSGYLRDVAGRLLYVDKLTFSAKADDTGSGIIRYEYRITGTSGSNTDWISVVAGSEGFTYTFRGREDLYSISVRVYDQAGNCSEIYTTDICILENTHTEDAQRNPVPDVSLQTPAGQYGSVWTMDTVTVTVFGSTAVSGVEYYEYRVDHADPAISDTLWQKVPVADGKATLTVNRDTNATYYFRAVSYAGNTSLIASRTVLVQKTAPNAAELTKEAATGANGWYTILPEYQISLPAQGAFSAPVKYRIDCTHDGDLISQTIYDGTNAPQITEDGLWIFHITAIDAAENTASGQESAIRFYVDTKAPTGIEVTMDGTSILNITNSTAVWNQVNILNRVLHSDYSIFLSHSVTVKASARGGDSELSAIYYQVVPEIDQYNANGNWTELDAEGLRLSPDGKYHLYFKAVDMAGNTTYFSAKSLILDDTAPGSTVSLTDTNLSVHGFYKGDVTVNISITDPAAGSSAAFAGLESITYRVLKDGQETQAGKLWPGSGDMSMADGRASSWAGSVMILGGLNDSNDVKLEITVTDVAGNTSTYISGDAEIKIDMTAPAIKGKYDRNVPLNTIFDIGCFTGKRELTISVTELNFIPTESFIHVIDTDTGTEEVYTWASVDGLTHTVAIPVTADGHYTVTASITDAAGNTTEQILFADGTVAGSAFVIDNTPSEIEVSYDNNSVKNELFFASDRTVTVTVFERNFDPAKINAVIEFIAEDGSERTISLTDWHSDGNTHTATMELTTDGIYKLSVTGKDALGNRANDTIYGGAASQHWVLDTYMDNPVFSAVAGDKAYNGPLVPEITVLDANIDTITMTLIRTRMYEIDLDVTDLLLGGISFEDIVGGKMAALDIFPLEEGMDGRYTLTVNCMDKAGNTSTKSISFYANRFGSIYLYDEYVESINGGYLYEVDQDIIITEINPSGILDASSLVQITVDGVPVPNPIFKVVAVEVSKSGWFEYRYEISKENFTKDGSYNIVISSKDTAGNIPENTSEDLAIRFAVDTTAPELSSISGLENAIVKGDSLTVTLNAMDNVALKSITVYLNGEILETWEDLDGYVLEKSFSIPAGLEQSVRIVVVDKVGNTLDTDLESFTPGYEFNRTVTVSTNFFLRLYANRTLFYGLTGGVAALLIGGVSFLVVLLKKRQRKAQG